MVVWLVVGLVVLLVFALAFRADLRRRRLRDLGGAEVSGRRAVRAENQRRADTWGGPSGGRPDGGVGGF